jgi:hypothetical protein
MAASQSSPNIIESSFDIWRKVPPEEKLELMARAQSKGVGASLVILIITATVAVGLRLPWVFWAAFATVPFAFQFASARAWRDIKPRTVLEYLAARSAARRYAYGAQAADLTVDLMFKGRLGRDFSSLGESAELDARLEDRDAVNVWVSLFPDTIVMISERAGGAKLEMVYSTIERLAVTAEGFDDSSPEQRRLVFDVEPRKGERERWFLTSPYPAALLVCERKIKRAMEENKIHVERQRLATSTLFNKGPAEEESSSLSFL